MKKAYAIFEAITDEQNRMIHAIARAKKVSHDQLYDRVRKLIGIPSISALSKQEAAFIISRMQGGFPGKIQPPKSVDQMKDDAGRYPNVKHIVGIRLIARDLGWDKEHLKNWLQKYLKVHCMRELDRESATKAFIGMKKIEMRQREMKANK
jgi:hypothetical protein